MINENEVRDFIVKVSNLSPKYDKIRRCINIPLLIDNLKELDELVEVYAVKSAIIRQVNMLIVLIIKNDQISLEKEMLHTVFYGNPGVGKSRTAFVLAKIWQALGILSTVEGAKDISCKNQDFLTKINQIRDEYISLYDKYLTPEFKDCKSMFRATQDSWLSIRNNLVDLDIKYKPVGKGIVVAGREDFVAEYSGQTSIKAFNFLNSCKGKCLIIEEAYLLCLSETDTYGMEAITTLNRFMDEHSAEIIVIFTGYEDKLKSSIFKAQPGLQRRCQWFFNLQGYSPAGLSQIFIRQLSKMGWSCEDPDYVKQFLASHLDSFPNFGGDTERLAFQCKLLYSSEVINHIFEGEDSSLLVPTITNSIIQQAFNEYKKNQILIYSS
jgi:hypothetical protein